MEKEKLQIALLCINTKLREACRTVTKFYSDTLEPSGIPKPQFSLLVAIAIFGQETVLGLSNILNMEQSTVTRNINVLKSNGWVQSVLGEDDKRTRFISLTAEGYEMLESSFPYWQNAQNEVIEYLGEEDAQVLMTLLQKIIDFTANK